MSTATSTPSVMPVRSTSPSTRLERERVLRAEGRFVSKLNPNSSEILDILAYPFRRRRCRHGVRRRRDPRTGCRQLRAAELPGRGRLRSPSDRRIDRTDPRRGVSALRLRSAHLRRIGDRLLRAGAHGGMPTISTRTAARSIVIRITGSKFEKIMASFRVSKRLAHEGTTWILGSGRPRGQGCPGDPDDDPGFTARRLFVQRRTVYIAQRVPGEAVNEAGVGMLSAAEVKRRIRWLPTAGLRRIGWRKTGLEPDRPRLIRGRRFGRSMAHQPAVCGMGSPGCTGPGQWPGRRRGRPGPPRGDAGAKSLLDRCRAPLDHPRGCVARRRSYDRRSAQQGHPDSGAPPDRAPRRASANASR